MKCTFHIPVKRRIVLFLLLTLSFAGFAQPENTIAEADRSIQQLREWRIIGPFKDTIRNIGDPGAMKYAALQSAQNIIDTVYRQEKDLTDLEALFKTNAKMIGYATCKVYSDKDQEMVFFINADDVMRFRINDSVAFTVPAYTHNEAVVRRGFFKKGVSTLIAEINNTGGGKWGFDIDITTAENARHMATAFLSAIPKNSVTEATHSKIQLKNWKIIGPFSNTLGEIDESRLGYLQFIPQNAGRTTIDTLYQQGKEGVDLGKLLNTEMRGITYAVCDVVSEEDQDLAFLVNVDDEIRLWKNNDLNLVVTGYTGSGAVIKKMNIKKGVSRLIAEIRNTGGGTWWFDINACSYDYIRDNALFPGFYLSSRKFIIPEGDNLYLEVADTDMVPVKNISTVKIYDARNKNCYTGCIDLKKDNKFTLPNLAAGAYRYELYTDRDTLTEYFCYGAIDKIYNREELTQKYKNNNTVNDVLPSYIPNRKP